MKRKKKLLNQILSVICMLAICISLTFSNGDVPVAKAAEGDIAWNQLGTVFTDTRVCNYVKQELLDNGLTEGATVTQDDLNRVYNLEVDGGNGVINLAGVERLSGLSYVNLEGNIQSLAPLNNLTELRSLHLSYVHDDISFAEMSNVSSIENLYCYYSDGIKSLDGLEKNTKMKSLQVLSCDNFTDTSACANFTSLSSVSFYSSEALADISSLSGLSNLISVDLGLTSVTDISALRGKTGIKTLKMQNSEAFEENADTTCQVLTSLTGLETLCLRNAGVDDAAFEKICNLTNLTLLDLLSCEITDLEPVKKLVNLELLDISDNGISDLSPLKSLTKLQGYSCCNSSDKAQYVVFSGPGRTVENPFKDMDGNIIVPQQTDYFTYNATDNTITYTGLDWRYARDFATIQMNYNGRTFDMALHIRFEEIVDPITITTQPKSVSVIEEDEIILSVEVDSYDKNFFYQWYKDDVAIKGADEATFSIDKASAEDVGSYKCVIKNNTDIVTSDVVKVEIKKEEVTTEEVTTEEVTTEEPTTEETTEQGKDALIENDDTTQEQGTEDNNIDDAVSTGDGKYPLGVAAILLLSLVGIFLLRRNYNYQ